MARKWWEKITPWNDRDLSRRLKKLNASKIAKGAAGHVGRAVEGLTPWNDRDLGQRLSKFGRGAGRAIGQASRGVGRAVEGLTPWNDQDLRNRFRKARGGLRNFTDRLTPWNDASLRSSMRRSPFGRAMGFGSRGGSRNQMGAEQPGYGGPRGKSRYMNRGFYEDGGHVKPEPAPQEAPAESSSVGTPTTVYQSHNSNYEEGK